MKYAPKSLGTAGRELWNAMLSDAEDADMEYGPSELSILTDLCHTEDVIASLVEALDGADLTARGSHGGTIANPLLSELRQYRAIKLQLAKRLEIPAESVEKDSVKTRRARLAADTRWRMS